MTQTKKGYLKKQPLLLNYNINKKIKAYMYKSVTNNR